MKSREQLYKENFLNIAQIQRLFGLSYNKAKKAYDLADEFDDKALKEFRVEDKKVRRTTVLKVVGITDKELARSIF